MFGQLIQRLAASSVLPVAEEESPIAQDSPARQWRVVSQDGVRSLFGPSLFGPGLPEDNPGEDNPVGPNPIEPIESTVAENEAEPAGAWSDTAENDTAENDTAKQSLVASFVLGTSAVGPRQRPPTSRSIGMPAALPLTSEILQAAAESRSIETQEPSRPGLPRPEQHSAQPDRMASCVKEAVHADPSSPAMGDADAISRSLVADAAPVRFRAASPLALLKAPAAGPEIDANLAKIISQWPHLTRPAQAAVLAMVDAAAHES